jgi:hypothetical protein
MSVFVVVYVCIPHGWLLTTVKVSCQNETACHIGEKVGRGVISFILYCSHYTAYGLDDAGFESRNGEDFFCSPKCPDRLWGRSKLLFNVYRGSFTRGGGGVKRSGREFYHTV